jgi:hypothetical protein
LRSRGNTDSTVGVPTRPGSVPGSVYVANDVPIVPVTQ